MKILGRTGVISRNRRPILWVLGAAVILSWLFIYRLGSLTGGLSQDELAAASAHLGWHGIYLDPMYLPLKLVRSLVFFAFPSHGQMLARLPDAIFGMLAAISFAWLIRLWYGARIAALAAAMFTFGAWTLHVSRFAGWEVMYLWGMTSLLLGHSLLRKYHARAWAWFGALVIWGLLAYIPGMIWLVLADIFLQRRFIIKGWGEVRRWWVRLLYVLAWLIFVPLLAIDLARAGRLTTWLGLPGHIDGPGVLLKHFTAVPVHLFIRGPEYPQLWLGRLPVLDIFSLVICILGIYFYATHWQSARSRLVGLAALIGLVLVGLGGPVSLSLLVPLLYVSVATGLAYMLSQWLRTFPSNPLARGLGLGLVVFAVVLSCTYNYRAYFVAWPHTAITRSVFQYRLHP